MDSIKEVDNPDFPIRPANNHYIGPVKNIVFTVLTEYGLKPGEGGKDRDLNHLEQHYF